VAPLNAILGSELRPAISNDFNGGHKRGCRCALLVHKIAHPLTRQLTAAYVDH
jgi:hypothetical protein